MTSTGYRQVQNFQSSQQNAALFTSSPNTNPKFNPGIKSAQKVTVGNPVDPNTNLPIKPPKAPEKPLTPYMRFSKKYLPQVWETVRASNPEAKLWDIGKTIGTMWREMAEPAKQVFFEEYENEKLEYEKLMKAYKHSPAYLAYEQSVHRSKAAVTTVQKPEKPAKQPVPAAPTSTEHGVYIQPVDEDEADDYYSLGKIASSRFQRNQRLMMDLFSSLSVPDLRTVVNVHRLNHARKQLRSLSSHQRNIENELQQMTADFQVKKRSLEESSQNFSRKLQKISEKKANLDEAYFEALVAKHEKQMLDYYVEYNKRQRESIESQDANSSQDITLLLQEILFRIDEELSIGISDISRAASKAESFTTTSSS